MAREDRTISDRQLRMRDKVRKARLRWLGHMTYSKDVEAARQKKEEDLRGWMWRRRLRIGLV